MCILIENIAFLNHQLQSHNKYSRRRKTFLSEKSAWLIFFFPLGMGDRRGGGLLLKKNDPWKPLPYLKKSSQPS